MPAIVCFTFLPFSFPFEELVLVHFEFGDLGRYIMLIRVAPYELLFDHESFAQFEHFVVYFGPFVVFDAFNKIGDHSEYLEALEGPI